MSPALTPCINICSIDDESALCMGCGRSLAEIADWGKLKTSERRSIMIQLPTRMEAAGLRPGRKLMRLISKC
ncbi:DUF1289 domain-containing protein [Notoacmeibacter ruber]|uniref:DUF1289 domain-containing protein n=1 Tax=Notoacmeibacter ruber TaxID=2670375 RepID=A0A3L7JBU1_9HYPH|nr:DUF1289 domain-containing protein [Notoacmeibacter ruber]RLQ88106.1 DUF1289 domain-containing protein [Notoacmeibacter ruber]